MRNFVTLLAVTLAACTTHSGSQSATAPEAAIAEPVAVIPFDMSTGRPVVQAMINGQGPYPFIFDTGSPILVILSPLDQELDLEVVGATQVGSPAGGEPVDADLVRIDAVTLGDAHLSSTEATVLNIPNLPVGAGAGVMGPALFRDYGRVTLDFTTNTILIGGEIDESAISTWMPIDPGSLHLNAPVRIGDQVIPGHIDTGAPALLSVPNEYQDLLPLTGPIRTLGIARTVDAEFEIRGAPIEVSARIGDAAIALTQIVFSALPVANVGSAGLAGMRIDIDWTNNRFALTRTSTDRKSVV